MAKRSFTEQETT